MIDLDIHLGLLNVEIVFLLFVVFKETFWILIIFSSNQI